MNDTGRTEHFSPDAFAPLARAEAGHWWFRSRSRMILWLLTTRVGAFDSFMEVGCGTGFVLEGVRGAYPAADLVGTEYFEEGLAFARQRVPSARFVQIDATAIASESCYDVIGAFDVLEHIEKDELALTNIVRAIKPGGTVAITVPQHRWLWSAMDDYACHVRRYTRAELVGKVRAAGIEVHYVSSFVSLLLPLMWLSRLRMKRTIDDPMAEFRIPRWLNAGLEAIMSVELASMKLGLRFPAGGSLVLIGRKP